MNVTVALTFHPGAERLQSASSTELIGVAVKLHYYSCNHTHTLTSLQTHTHTLTLIPQHRESFVEMAINLMSH
jgi:hypothetical protein